MSQLKVELINYALIEVSRNNIGKQEIYGNRYLVRKEYAHAKSYNPFKRGRIICPRCWANYKRETELGVEVISSRSDVQVYGCNKCGFSEVLPRPNIN